MNNHPQPADLWMFEVTTVTGQRLAIRAINEQWAINGLVVNGLATIETITGCNLVG